MDMPLTPQILPVLPLRTQVVFPNTTVSLEVGRGISVAAIDRARAMDDRIFLTRQRTDKELPGEEDLSSVGTVAVIRQYLRFSGEAVRLTVEGLYRAKAQEFSHSDGCVIAAAEAAPTVRGDEVEEEAHLRVIKQLLPDLSGDNKALKEAETRLAAVSDPEVYLNVVAHCADLKDEVKQSILSEDRLTERLQLLAASLYREWTVKDLEHTIERKLRMSISKSQRDFYLREQLKVIHAELGDDEQENDVLREKLLAKGLPAEVEEKALAELGRMDRMPSSSPEYTVLRNYADWLLDLPWQEQTEDTASLSEVEKILEEDHYGLEKIKERVLEYLAVLKLTGTLKAPILCLVGPPGVGKTSIAKSIARALGRKFVRMSLGGVKDEAEIRGHRRTYIGAMPGRILYEMKNAGAVNPVFLLDEVDKISSDLRGDPASALLEVLDPEQNSTFRDRYLEVPYDLSKVMFIATANTLETIPMPLRDRMEIIELSGYTQQEKIQIALRYLVAKKRKENGLGEKDLAISESAIAAMIDGYTMEAGVRSLERTIGAVCRKAAVRVAKSGRAKRVLVTDRNLEKFLGAKRFSRDGEMLERDEVGAATGLAWTSVGGTTLTIEVSAMRGKGDILLTGKLGDVMKESARAAISYIRSNAAKYGIAEGDFEKKDIHIHIPEGATPKDGPSAGITMATAILSAFTGRPVRRDIAMTGEITLRGKVLPIGGLKEKALAAARIGVHDIIIPEENKKDVEEIPEEVRKTLRFICVSEIDEVFKNAVVGLPQ